MTRRIYVASSWRNEEQPRLVKTLLEWGHKIYDFRNPLCQLAGFQWSELDPDWQKWNTQDYRKALLTHPRAAQGFMADMRAMEWADTCILLHPCGRSAHLELGYMAGRGKYTVIFLREQSEPELMALIANHIVVSYLELGMVLKGS